MCILLRVAFLAINVIVFAIPGTSRAQEECTPRFLGTFADGRDLNDSATVVEIVEQADQDILVVGGDFTSAGSVAANHIAAWDGVQWSTFGMGLNERVETIELHDDGRGAGPQIYVGGEFIFSDNTELNRVAKWDGTGWRDLAEGMDGRVLDLKSFDDGSGNGRMLYAGGVFNVAGGVKTSGVARWDGSSWSRLGDSLNNFFVNSLEVFDDGSGGGPSLYASGAFTSIGGKVINRIAKWTGADWVKLGAGLGPDPRDLIVFDDGTGPALYASGRFESAGTTGATNIAKWDGIRWKPVGDPGLMISNRNISGLAIYRSPLDQAPSLYAAGGQFFIDSVFPRASLTKWNSTEWQGLAGDVTFFDIVGTTDFNFGIQQGLYIVGPSTVNGQQGIVHWGCEPNEVVYLDGFEYTNT